MPTRVCRPIRFAKPSIAPTEISQGEAILINTPPQPVAKKNRFDRADGAINSNPTKVGMRAEVYANVSTFSIKRYGDRNDGPAEHFRHRALPLKYAMLRLVG